jgi:hypothetical protein
VLPKQAIQDGGIERRFTVPHLTVSKCHGHGIYQSRRWYYIIHQYQLQRGLQCVSVASSFEQDRPRYRGGGDGKPPSPSQFTTSEMYDHALSLLQGPPQVTLAFSTSRPPNDEYYRDDGPLIHHDLARRSPSSSMILVGLSDKVLSAGIHRPIGSRSMPLRNPELKGHQTWTMLSGLPSNTYIQPFLLPGLDYPPDHVNTYIDDHFDSKLDWKLVILYVVEMEVYDFLSETFTERIQSRFPGIIVVGGDCSAAFVSVPIQKQTHFQSVNYMIETYSSDELRQVNADIGGHPIPSRLETHEKLAAHIYNEIQRKFYQIKGFNSFHGDDGGICGIALAGNVPVRCVVSLGVESLTAREQYGDGTPRPITNYSVRDSVHDSHIRDGERIYHRINSIRDINTGEILDYRSAVERFGGVEYIGARFPTEDGFLLEKISEYRPNCFCLTTKADCRSLAGAYVDFFKYNHDLSVKDMEFCLTELCQQTSGDVVLGAVLFTCGTRFDRLDDEMSDVQRWTRFFPEVPCTGFVTVVGEIGPNPRAGRQQLFSHADDACALFGSAVMLIFLAPSIDLGKVSSIDDSDEQISAFIHERLANGTGFARPIKRKRQSTKR